VWYEWAVGAPRPGELHNGGGAACAISLDADARLRRV
jgi:hypothetical protein